MPRGDRTGPAGAGPMTGRAAGFCAELAAPGYANWGGGGRGMGFGRGGGGGRGFGCGWGSPLAAPIPPVAGQELAMLKQQAQRLQTDMELIQARIQELEAKQDNNNTAQS